VENQQKPADFQNADDALPVIGYESIIELLNSDDSALANAMRRLVQSQEASHRGNQPEILTAFGSAVPED